mmetsp:Transcript_69786/g.226983  ORF Transcript_69786/g.226983 Transcript_69786/m.226983 type:complete len:209 (-) Transcript_69786:316-942(-)
MPLLPPILSNNIAYAPRPSMNGTLSTSLEPFNPLEASPKYCTMGPSKPDFCLALAGVPPPPAAGATPTPAPACIPTLPGTMVLGMSCGSGSSTASAPNRPFLKPFKSSPPQQSGVARHEKSLANCPRSDRCRTWSTSWCSVRTSVANLCIPVCTSRLESRMTFVKSWMSFRNSPSTSLFILSIMPWTSSAVTAERLEPNPEVAWLKDG